MNKSLQEKSSARLAAAQLLYKHALTGEALSVRKMLDDYEAYREDPNEAELPEVAPNAVFLRKLLEGVTTHAETLEPWVEKCLLAERKKERVSPLLLSILRLALFELSESRNLPVAVIVTEYVNLAAHFFAEAETGFVHAALNTVAKELRE